MKTPKYIQIMHCGKKVFLGHNVIVQGAVWKQVFINPYLRPVIIIVSENY